MITITKEEQIFELLYSGKMAWSVEKKQLYTESGKLAKGGFATTRSDTGDILGVVGSRYLPLQNQELVKGFLESALEFDFKSIETGILNNGEKVYIRGYLGDIQIGTDTVKRYIGMTNTHNGTQQIRYFMNSKVQVCSNGMHREISHHELARVKHTTNATEKMHNYVKGLSKVLWEEEQMMNNCKKLAEVEVNSKHIQALIQTLYKVNPELPEEEIATRTANRVKEFDNALANNGLNVHGNTLWGALQAMTYLSTRSKAGEEGYMTGTGLEMSILCFDSLMKMIDNPIYELV